jgi:tetratricopeptide (TPR) repeat protein
MAKKRRKLNKRVAIVLGCIGALVIALGVTTALTGNWLDRLFPKDPFALMEQARKFVKEGDRQKADEEFKAAARVGASAKSPKMASFYTEISKFNYDWAMDGTGLTETQRRERFGQSITLARKALLMDAKYVPAQQFLCEVYWNLNVHAGSGQGQDWNGFIKEADALIKLQGDDAETYFRRGSAKAELIDPTSPGDLAKEARNDFDKAIEIKPKEPRYWLGLIGHLDRLRGNEAQIEKAFQNAVEANPDDAGLLVNYAGFLRKQKRPEDALKQLDLAVQKDPVLGNLALAEYYSANNDKPKVTEVLDKIIAAAPLDMRAYVGKASVLGSDGKNEEALAVLEQGLEALEKAPATQPATRPAAGRGQSEASGKMELLYLKANVLMDMVEAGSQDPNDPQRQKLLKQVDECYPTLRATKFSGPMFSRLTGRMALAKGRINEAEKDLEDAYNNARGFDLKVANLLIKIYLRKNLPGKAGAILDKLLHLSGQENNISALMAKIQLLIGYHEFEKADRLVAWVLKLDPNNPEAVNTRAILKVALGEAPTLPPGVKPDPRTMVLLLERAVDIWQNGKRDEAIKYVEQLRASSPDDRNVFSRLFGMYRAVGKLDDAEKLVDEAIKARPDDKTLVARKKLLRETDPNTQYKIMLDIADEYPSPQSLLEKIAIAALFGKEKQADYRKFLSEASNKDPNNIGVVERLLEDAIANHDWGAVEDCVARAGRANLDGCNGRLYRMRVDTARTDFDAVIDTGLKVLADEPNRKDARCLLGQAYLRKRFFDDAYRSFKIVYDNDPGYVPALKGLAAATSTSGLNKESEHREYVARAYALAPNDPYVIEWKMEIEQATTSPQELIAQREKSLRQSPDDLRNIVSLGTLYERVSRFDEAENMYVTFFQKTDNKLVGAQSLCSFYQRRNRPKDVERIIEPMLSESKDPVGVRVLYAELLTAAEPQRAQAFLENAIVADPKDPRGHLGLARFWAAQATQAARAVQAAQDLPDLQAKWKEAVKAMANYVRLRPEDIGGVKEFVRYCIEAGENELAGKRLDGLLKADPRDAASETLRGLLALRQSKKIQDLEVPIRLFTQAIQDSPAYADPLIYRAQVYRIKGEIAKAKTDLQEAKRLTNRIDVAMELGTVLEALRDEDGAELVYREVHGNRPDYAPAIARLVMIYMNRQKYLDLEKLLAEAKKTLPSNPTVFLWEAHMWRMRDNIPSMLASLAEAVRLAPNSPECLQPYLMSLMDAKQYDQVVKVSEPYMQNKEFAGWVGAIRAGALFHLKQFDQADQLFLASLNAIQPQLVLLEAQQMQAAYGTQGAISRFRRWMEGGLKNWRAHLVLGLLQAEQKDPNEAVKNLIQARDLAQEPEAKYLANRHLGAAYYQLNMFKDCERAYLAALEAQRGDVQIANNLAYLYTNDLDEPKKALPFAEKASKSVPNDAKVLDTYGWTLAKLGNLAEAEQVLLRAVQLESPLTVSRYHLGWVYEQLNRLNEAKKQYQQGQTMINDKPDDPLYGIIKAALERVNQKLERGSGK